MDQVKAVTYGARASNGGAAQSSGRVTAHTQRAGVLNLSGPARPERTLGRVFFSFAFAAGLVLLVPFAMVIVGLPAAAVVRGLIEIVQRLLTGTG